jgi:hypothetical protein
MLIWISAFVILFGLGVWLSIVSSKNRWEGREMIGWILSIVFFLAIFFGTISGITNYSTAVKYSLRIPEIQLEVPSSEYESAELVIEKHDINEWIREAKISRAVYGDFSFYPELVLDLQPIP